MPEASINGESRGGLGGFDYFVLAGAAVNLLVIGYLIGYWLLGG